MKKLTIAAMMMMAACLGFAQTKKDGTPDKRFKANATAPAPKAAQAGKGATTAKADPVPAPQTKKDGTPDKRFKANNTPAAPNAPVAAPQTKKDGTPDRRFKNNQPAAPTAQPTPVAPPAPPVSAPARVSAPAPAEPHGTIVNGRHVKKDGTPDMRYKENQDLKHKPAAK